MSICLIYCTCPDQETAKSIAKRLINDRLSACVNILPQLTSVYAWKGNIEEDQEVLLLIKTSEANYAPLDRAIFDAHPYELPEIIAVPVEHGLPGYIDWVVSSTRP